MTIQGYNFIFNNQSNEEFRVLLCKFDSITSSSNDEELEITTSKTYGSDIFHLVNIDYANPLKFTLTICKADGTYFSSDEQRAIKKWLCRRDGYHWLYVEQDDLNDIRYNVIISFSQMVDIGGKNGGMSFNVQCDSPFPYSFDKTITKICTAGALTFDTYNDSDFADSDNAIYPNIEITSNTTGTISIKNNTTTEEMIFTECVVGEVITISNNEVITTTANRTIIDYWNYNIIYLIDGTNNITITGNCTVKFTYSSPKRVGG